MRKEVWARCRKEENFWTHKSGEKSNGERISTVLQESTEKKKKKSKLRRLAGRIRKEGGDNGWFT